MTTLNEAMEHQFNVDGELVTNERHEPVLYAEALPNQRRFITGHDLIARSRIARNRAKQYLEAAENMERMVSDHLGLKVEAGNGGFCDSCRNELPAHYAGCALEKVANPDDLASRETMWAVPPITGSVLDAIKRAVSDLISDGAGISSPNVQKEVAMLRVARDRLDHSSRVR